MENLTFSPYLIKDHVRKAYGQVIEDLDAFNPNPT
jgi:hypothetical protein